MAFSASIRKSGFSGLIGFLKSISVVPIWFFVLLISLLLGKHVWMGPALKPAYSGGCLLAYCGLSLIRYREGTRAFNDNRGV